MSVEDIIKIVQVAANIGITKIKITGGEPLVRPDLIDIITGINKVRGIEEISLTTNGVLLAPLATKLKQAGLKRVNVSLDTVNTEKYKLITGVDKLKDVIKGIDEAIEVGLNPVKVNMVILKDLNDNEVKDMIEWSKEKKIILQLIELIPLGRLYKTHHVSLDEIEKYLENIAIKIEKRKLHNRKKYFLHPSGQVEIVKPVHNTDFCSNCSRIRLTSDGYLKPCLMRDDNLVDILTVIRNGGTELELRNKFIEAINRREPFYKKSYSSDESFREP